MTPGKIIAIGFALMLVALALGAANGVSWHGFCVMNCNYGVTK